MEDDKPAKQPGPPTVTMVPVALQKSAAKDIGSIAAAGRTATFPGWRSFSRKLAARSQQRKIC